MRKKKKKENRSVRIIYTMAVLTGTAAASAFLYPSIARTWNRYVAGTLVSSYQETVNEKDESTYEEWIAAARTYNEALYKHSSNNIAEYTYNLSGETGVDTGLSGKIIHPDEEYESLLNTGDDEMMGYVEIPSINVLLPVYHYTSEEVLAKGVGHLYGSSLPVGGENTHTVLTGHSGLMTAKMFTDLEKLEEGDTFIINTMGEELFYEVDEINVVLPYQIEDLSIEDGQDLATLVTCTPYGVNSHRLLVRGHRIQAEEKTENEKVMQKTTEAVPFPWTMFCFIASAAALCITVICHIWREN